MEIMIFINTQGNIWLNQPHFYWFSVVEPTQLFD